MTKTIFYRGLPILFACQLKTTDTPPVPVDITGYTQIAVYARSGLNAAIAMTVQIVNAAQGTFSAVIADTCSNAAIDHAACCARLALQQRHRVGLRPRHRPYQSLAIGEQL